MYKIVIVRCDTNALVIKENVKHAWWQDDRLVLDMGENGAEHWLSKVIDHVRIIEHEAHA